MERKSVWLVEHYFKDTETPAIAAWSTRDLAVRDAEEHLKGDTGVEKQLERDGLCSWRSDSRQIFVGELLVADTYGFAPRAPPTPKGDGPPQALLILSELERRRAAPADLLQCLYGLTPAEARVAVLLAEGHTLEDIAAQGQVALGTVRNQLKQVFSKTDTHRQVQVVRLVLGVAETQGLFASCL